jgi:ribonuclease HI
MSILSITSNANKVSKHGTRIEGERWTKPRPRYIKLNVDAAFHEDSQSGAAGAVLRDIDGQFVVASCFFISHVSTPMMTEAIAMREGLELANRLNMSRIQAESDSTEIIDACKEDERWWNEASAVFANCVDLVTTIGDVSFSHCPREANRVAHELARFCFLNCSSCNWVDEPPRFLLDSLINDVTVL